MLIRNFVERIRSDSRGSTLIIAALAMPAVIGAAGLAVDTVQWTLWKQQMQRAADSSALAGAYALTQGKSAQTSAIADLAKSDAISYTTRQIQNAPSTGAHAGNNRAVRVVLVLAKPLPFSKLFLASPPALRAEATAAVVAEGEHCFRALYDGEEAGVTLTGNPEVTLGCGVATNSRSTNAITAGGSSRLSASPISAVGGITPSSNFVGTNTRIEPYSYAQTDPFADLAHPTLPSNCSNELRVGPQQTRTIASPPPEGICFRGADIKGTLTLGAGVYYIDGADFSTNSGASISGTGVTIILTSRTADTDPSSIGTVQINGGTTINLSGPTSGTYKGVIFYQDRRASTDKSKVSGNATSSLAGSLYFRNSDLEFTGTSGMTTRCIQIVSRKIELAGNANITNVCPDGKPRDFTGSRVRLVG